MENRKINRFEKDVLRHIRNDINDALKSVCDKYGVCIKIGNIKFSAVEFNAKLTAVIVNSPTGEILSPDQVIFNQHCSRHNLTPADFGAKFTFGSDTFEICGIKHGSKKYPILAKNRQGRSFKFASWTIQNQLAAAKLTQRTQPKNLNDISKLVDKPFVEGDCNL